MVTTIQIDERTKALLDRLKVHHRQSYNEIIVDIAKEKMKRKDIMSFAGAWKHVEDKEIKKMKNEIVTTELNVFEIYVGIHQKEYKNSVEEKTVENFFNSITILPLDVGCGRRASELLASLMKVGKMINQNDILIASILQKNNVGSIITRNTKHFSSISGLKVISY